MLSAGDAFQQSHVHFLPLEGDFLDYLRLGLGRRRLSEPLARRFKEAAEHLAEEAASEKAAPGLEVQTEERADRGGKEGSQRTTRNLELNGGKG
jgi:hypothetical protein